MEMISVLEVISSVESSDDFGSIDDYPGDTDSDRRAAFWEDIIVNKASDKGFGKLVDSIIEHGFVNSSIGWHDGRISEGHHRIVAAILLCLDEIPYTWYGSEWWEGRTEVVNAHWGGDEPIYIED